MLNKQHGNPVWESYFTDSRLQKKTRSKRGATAGAQPISVGYDTIAVIPETKPFTSDITVPRKL